MSAGQLGVSRFFLPAERELEQAEPGVFLRSVLEKVLVAISPATCSAAAEGAAEGRYAIIHPGGYFLLLNVMIVLNRNL